jgi:hypothetical protein
VDDEDIYDGATIPDHGWDSFQYLNDKVQKIVIR